METIMYMLYNALEDQKNRVIIGVDLRDVFQKIDDEIFLYVESKKQHNIKAVERFIRKQLNMMMFTEIDCIKISQRVPKNCRYVGTIEELVLSKVFLGLSLPI